MKKVSPLEIITRILITLLVISAILYMLLGPSWRGVMIGVAIVVGVYLLTINIIKDIRRNKNKE